MVAVDATLQVEQPDASLAALLADAARALTVSDATARATLASILAELEQKLEAFPADFPDVALLAKAETIRALLAGTLSVGVVNLPAEYPLPAAQVATLTPPSDGLTDAELRAAPVPVSGTVTVSEPVTVDATDLDIRSLASTSDSVRSVDAAETVGLIAVPFTLTASGSTTLVAAPGGASRLRLRRISPTIPIRTPDTDPILALFVGAVEAQRGNVLTGRFDITAASSADAITITVDAIDAGGKVPGTIYYELI